MTEVGGLTELQMLETEAATLKRTLEGLEQAEPTSTAAARIISNIKSAEETDAFLLKEGGQAEANQYHSSAGQAADGGCCIVL